MPERSYNFKIDEQYKDKRLDHFLAEQLSNAFSRSFLQKLIDGGSVLVNGEISKCSAKLSAGDAVQITIPPLKETAITPENIHLDIVYEDEHLLVVNKKAGMVTHPAPGNWAGTLVNALLWHCKKLSGIGGVAKPGIVHRLDKDTSGLLVVAKTDQAHRSLSKQFKAKATKRVYVTLVKGVVELDSDTIELPIGRSSHDRKKMAVSFENSKEAITRYRVLERFKDSTLLELVLGTGRTHQIRVHMAHIGHPVLGDEKYGTKGPIARPALHAKTIGFTHPTTCKQVEFTSELPDDMKELIEKMRGRVLK